jgi:hypothetical protein
VGSAGPSKGIPIEPRREGGASFPLVGPAVAVLALHGILSAVDVPGPLRSWTAIAASFATGYCALSVVAGEHVRMTSAETLAFTTGLTILLISLSGLAVSIVGIPITQFVVVFVGLPLGVIAFVTRRPAFPRMVFVDFARRWFDLSDYSKAERGIAAVLLVGIAVALGVFISLASVLYPDTSSMAIAITGPNGSEDVPESFVRNVSQTIVVHVLANATPGSESFTVGIRLLPEGATGSEPVHAPLGTDPLRLDAFAQHNDTSVVVSPSGTWMKSYSIALDFLGPCTLRFQLLTAGGAFVSETYLALNVTSS